MNDYKDKMVSIEERIQNLSTEVIKNQHSTRVTNINLEEQLRKINKLNSDFFNLYNRIRVLSIFSIISSVVFLTFIIIIWIVK